MNYMRIRVCVKGRVQGVYFRASAKEKARSIGVFGWVRNLPSGDVESVFEGTRKNVEDMLIWCLHGPSMARVIKLEVKVEEFCDEFESFKILYQ